MSSHTTATWGWRRSTAAMASSSARLLTMPVGLEGLLSTSSLLAGVMAASRRCGSSRKPSAAVLGIRRTLAPASWAISG